MGYLLGLQEYLNQTYETSVFDRIVRSKELWIFHIHGSRTAKATVLENLRYDMKLDLEGQIEDLPKTQVKFLYPAHFCKSVGPLIKIDKKVRDLGLGPIISRRKRYFIKNKSLFPLMKEKQVVYFTLLEGEIIRGIIIDFSRYDVTVSLKGGIPVTVLRHAVYDLRNKKGRCFLKSVQEEQMDWQKSELFVP
ncbi:MAG: hypothetical protein AB1487_02490 [Thermodesulfobacteriota bacterium]